MAAQKRSSAADFELLGKLGEGAYGQVYKAKRLEDDRVYVIKRVFISELPRNEQLAAINEVKILASMDHDHVVKYFDSFIDEGSLHIVMEFCEKGDLAGMMKRARGRGEAGISELRTWSLLAQILLGLHYLHRRRVLHRDMKTANVFLTTENGKLRVKIGDMGVAKLLGTGKAFADTVVGTPYYLSPELVQDVPYNGQSDMWALGVILYECCTLKRPFEASNQCALILKIVRGDYEPVPSERASSGLRDVVHELLNLDPRQRPSAKRLLSRPAVQRELLALGLALPDDVARFEAKGVDRPLSRGSPSKTPAVSSRLESLSKPRPQNSQRRSDQPQPNSPPPQHEPQQPGAKIRGGRVRGGGNQRVVSSRAASSRPLPTNSTRWSAAAATSTGTSPPPPREMLASPPKVTQRLPQPQHRSPLQAGDPPKRPTVSDLLHLVAEADGAAGSARLMGTTEARDDENDGSGGMEEEIRSLGAAEVREDETLVATAGPDVEEVGEGGEKRGIVKKSGERRKFACQFAEQKGNFDEGLNDEEEGEGPVVPPLHQASAIPPLPAIASGEEPIAMGGRMKPLGWAAAVRSRFPSVSQGVDEEEVENEHEDSGAIFEMARAEAEAELWAIESEAAAEAAADAEAANRADEEEDDEKDKEKEEEEEYSDDGWEDDDDDDREISGCNIRSEGDVVEKIDRQCASFRDLAATARRRAVEALGNEEAFDSLFREVAGASGQEAGEVDVKLLFEKVTAACKNDRFEAQQVAFAIQKVLVAEAGLREAEIDRGLALLSLARV